LYRDADRNIKGTNTDGEAALVTFTRKFGAIDNKQVMILGAGGAGKAVASYFSSNAGSSILVTRSMEGKNYADKLGVKWMDWNHVGDVIDAADIVVNCTSVGFGDQEDKSPLSKKEIDVMKKSAIVFDIVYQPIKTKLLEIADNNSISIFNGLEMNMEQAVLAYQYAAAPEKDLDEIRRVMSQI
jgi:shikimate dehydrogenase